MAGGQTRQKKALRDEVRDVLLSVMRDETAGAAARASACRSLLEMDRDDGGDRDDRPAAEMTEQEIDDEIARIRKR